MADPAPVFLLEHLRLYLSAEGIARPPDEAGVGHPLYLHPKDGPIAPRQKKGVEADGDLVFSVFGAGGIASQPHEGFLRQDGVDLWIRCLRPADAYAQEHFLRMRFDDRRGWDMAGLEVIESRVWREMQPLGQDENGWTFQASYLFERRSGKGPPNA